MRPSTGSVLIAILVSGLIFGGAFLWAMYSPLSPLCGGCYRYNAPGCMVTPCPGREGLNLDSSQVNSPTNVTLNIRNTGSVGIGFDAYKVTDGSSYQYMKMNWTGPFVYTNQVAAINIIIDGTAFTFHTRYTYNIALTTTRNNIFTFTITA